MQGLLVEIAVNRNIHLNLCIGHSMGNKFLQVCSRSSEKVLENRISKVVKEILPPISMESRIRLHVGGKCVQNRNKINGSWIYLELLNQRYRST